MFNIEQFGIEFNKRHNFTYEDVNFLPKKYYYIAFENIPEAWVCSIDHYLEKLEEPIKIFGISQHSGFIVVDSEDLSDSDNEILNSLEKNLRLLDLDLYEQLDNINRNALN